MRKKTNALRSLYQRTINNEELRESRKQKYFGAKKMYQLRIRKEKFNLWKEYCNVTSSSIPWSQVYKLAKVKVRSNTLMTTLRKPDGTEISSILETMNIMLVHLITVDREEEETYYHKNIRKMIEEPIQTCDDIDFTQGK
jgi:phosphatidate phosphatase PAH1